MKQIKNKNCVIIMYDGLMEFIDENKKYFPSKNYLRQNKIFSDGIFIWDYTFNDEWHDFISFCLHEIKINKYDNDVKIYVYGDGIFSYEIKLYKNNKLIGFYELG